jgi:hypothetical protein
MSGAFAFVYYRRKARESQSLLRASGSGVQGKKPTMLTLIKIAVAVAIGFAVSTPSFTPKADNANCKCSADA